MSHGKTCTTCDLKRGQRWHENVSVWREYESVDFVYIINNIETVRLFLWFSEQIGLFFETWFFETYFQIFQFNTRKTWIALIIGNPKYVQTFWQF